MIKISRRRFSRLLGGASILAAIGKPYIARAAKSRVVVIGGGAGGAAAAKYIANGSKGAIEIILIEPSRHYYSCFFSNLYLGGFQEYASIRHSYENMSTHGVTVIHEWAENIDRDKKTVHLSSGTKLSYDRLVLSPGIELKYDSIPGYSVEASNKIPHAWTSGAQVPALKAKVEAMKKGGIFIMAPPPNPTRCPPGAYERISMIAHLLKQKNPTAKIIVLDPKDEFSMQALFQEGWERHYPGMIEWLPVSISGGIQEVDVASMSLKTDIETFKADAASIVPAQKAGRIAEKARLTDESGWCPIVPGTMQSKYDENIHIVGDASIASAMPKSGSAANSQAKVAAIAIRHALTGSRTLEPNFANICWGLIATEDCVKVGASYKAGEASIEATSKFISKTGEDDELRRQTYEKAIGWYAGIASDIFG